ncbi:hypothetical protein ACQCT6_01170 [Cytobacillus gottheilii]|uniref:hypothetical protein n=1 Tax=Cytobacillus gottheilii TaxID=859144 RepID=UPI003CF3B83B
MDQISAFLLESRDNSSFLLLCLVCFFLGMGDIYQIFCGSYQNISFSYQNCMVSYQTFEVSYQNFRFSYQIEFTDAKLPFLVLISAFSPGICIISDFLPLYLVRFSLQVGDIYQIFCGSYQNISFSYQNCLVSYQNCLVSYQISEVSYQNFGFSYQIEFTDAKLPFLVLISAFSPGICIISSDLPLYLVRFSLLVGDSYQIFCGSYQNISLSYQNCMVSYQTFEGSYQNFRFSYQIEFTDAKLPFLVLISAFSPGICIISDFLPLYLVRFSLQVGDIYQIFCSSYQNISFSYQNCMVSYQTFEVSYQNFRFSYQIEFPDAKLPFLVLISAFSPGICIISSDLPLYLVRFSLQVGDIYQIFCGSYQNISLSYQNCMVSYQTFEVSYQNFRFSYQIEFTDAKLPILV